MLWLAGAKSFAGQGLRRGHLFADGFVLEGAKKANIAASTYAIRSWESAMNLAIAPRNSAAKKILLPGARVIAKALRQTHLNAIGLPDGLLRSSLQKAPTPSTFPQTPATAEPPPEFGKVGEGGAGVALSVNLHRANRWHHCGPLLTCRAFEHSTFAISSPNLTCRGLLG
jgi:hypothetical protein